MEVCEQEPDFCKALRNWMRAQLEMRVPGVIFDPAEGLTNCIQYLHGKGMVCLRIEGQKRAQVFQTKQCLLSNAAFEYLYDFAETPYHTPRLGDALFATFKQLVLPLDEHTCLLFTPDAPNRRLVTLPLGIVDATQYTAVVIYRTLNFNDDVIACMPTQCQLTLRLGSTMLEIWHGSTHLTLQYTNGIDMPSLSVTHYYRLTDDAILSRLLVEQ